MGSIQGNNTHVAKIRQHMRNNVMEGKGCVLLSVLSVCHFKKYVGRLKGMCRNKVAHPFSNIKNNLAYMWFRYN